MTLNKADYVKGNIGLIQHEKKWKSESNGKSIPFKNWAQLKEYMEVKISQLSEEKLKELDKEWEKKDFVKSKIKNIAIKHYLYSPHLRDLLIMRLIKFKLYIINSLM